MTQINKEQIWGVKFDANLYALYTALLSNTCN